MKTLLMGGYAFYVWCAYGLAVTMVMLTVITMKQRHKRIRQILKQWFKQ